jgi:hypothetical protein
MPTWNNIPCSCGKHEFPLSWWEQMKSALFEDYDPKTCRRSGAMYVHFPAELGGCK